MKDLSILVQRRVEIIKKRYETSTFKTPTLSYSANHNLQRKSFENLMLEAGYPPLNINYNEKLHRFGKSKKLWYFASDYYGICGDWSCNLPKVEWKAGASSEFIIQAKKKFADEKIKNYEKSKNKAVEIYQKLSVSISVSVSVSNTHEYLKKKQIIDFLSFDKGLRMTASNSLAIPIKNIEGELTSLQFIYENGEKRFLAGGEVKGCFHVIGNLHLEAYICEGYATGLTLHAITSKCVIVCFNAGNLKPVCDNLMKKYPYSKLTIAGDNDLYSDKNTGKEKAEEVGLKVLLPTFKNLSTKPTDFNDFFFTII